MSVNRAVEQSVLGLLSLFAFLADIAFKLLAFFTLMLGGYILFLRSQADYGEYLLEQAALGSDARWAFWLDLMALATTKEALSWVLLWAMPFACIHSIMFSKQLDHITSLKAAGMPAQGGQA